MKKQIIDYLKKHPKLRRYVRWGLLQFRKLQYHMLGIGISVDPYCIIFESYMGRKYTCNPKALYLEMLTNPQYASYHFIWAFKETEKFSPDYVTGGYAKTKAEATRAVLKAAEEGLDVVVVHPSGILGPYDRSGNHLVQMVSEYLRGTLPACVKGGYDFVDVRDVASGCLLAAEKGRKGECYILSDKYCEIREVLDIVGEVSGKKKLPVLPLWMAKLAAPFMQLHSRRKKQRPLYTAYSLHVLGSGERFSHKKATEELGYSPRDLRLTIRDMVADMQGTFV